MHKIITDEINGNIRLSSISLHKAKILCTIYMLLIGMLNKPILDFNDIS